MKTLKFNFKIQDLAEMVYEEDYEDVNGTDRNLLRIIFNNLRNEVIKVAMDSMTIKTTPDTLTVDVPEKAVVRMLTLVIDLIEEIQGKVYIEDIYNIVDLHEINDPKMESAIEMLMVMADVIQ